jgi:hypothetical protein
MERNYLPGYSFCVITDAKEPQKLQREIESIRGLGIPDYEIQIVTDDAPPFGKTGTLRNKVCRKARFDHLIVVDDDMIFHDDFYQGLQRYGEDYDVLACRILNPDGSRYYDWKIHITGRDYLLDYENTHPAISLTSGIYIMKHWVFEKVQWSDDLGYYQGEDVDFCERLKDTGIRINFNSYCTVTHDAPYSQFGRVVYRQDLKGYIQLMRYLLGSLRNFILHRDVYSIDTHGKR